MAGLVSRSVFKKTMQRGSTMQLTGMAFATLFFMFPTMAFGGSVSVNSANYGLSGKYGAQLSVYCKDVGGGRKRVWINTSQGTFALNGPAIQWAQDANTSGSPIIGSDGKPLKLGRDHLPISAVSELIQVGLRQC